MNIQFFEVSQAADEAARLGRWMMDQCYKVEDNELANRLSKVGDMLVEFDMPYGTRWNDFRIWTICTTQSFSWRPAKIDIGCGSIVRI